MKWILFSLCALAFSCKKSEPQQQDKKVITRDTVIYEEPPIVAEKSELKKYSNARFRNVSVENVGGNRFRIKGEGQIFEANFSWVVEDGHNELKKGHQMTDAGAPEWGKFDFTIDVAKEQENSTLTLILFEISAMDGSRQYELPIVLE